MIVCEHTPFTITPKRKDLLDLCAFKVLSVRLAISDGNAQAGSRQEDRSGAILTPIVMSRLLVAAAARTPRSYTSCHKQPGDDVSEQWLWTFTGIIIFHLCVKLTFAESHYIQRISHKELKHSDDV